ncbi:hypothetical protein ACWFRM_22035 [Streptomyces sp. NPDC055144]
MSLITHGTARLVGIALALALALAEPGTGSDRDNDVLGDRRVA